MTDDVESLKQNKIDLLYIPDVNDLTYEAGVEKKYFINQFIKSA